MCQWVAHRAEEAHQSIDYQRDWDEVILRIQASRWWQSPELTPAEEREA